MNPITCIDNLSDCMIQDTITFWSKSSYQHIEFILQTFKNSKAAINSYFIEELNYLLNQFKLLNHKSKSICTRNDLYCNLDYFLNINSDFISILERLKFEGASGFCSLYQLIHHIIYEQRYFNNILINNYNINIPCANNVLITNQFANNAFCKSRIYCMYNQFYFLSLISSQHTSILQLLLPSYDFLPCGITDKFTEFANAFNQINYCLSDIYMCLEEKICIFKELLAKYEELNKSYIDFLCELNKENSIILPDSIRKSIPSVFYNVLSHIIDEQNYADILIKKFINYFNCKN